MQNPESLCAFAYPIHKRAVFGDGYHMWIDIHFCSGAENVIKALQSWVILSHAQSKVIIRVSLGGRGFPEVSLAGETPCNSSS